MSIAQHITARDIRNPRLDRLTRSMTRPHTTDSARTLTRTALVVAAGVLEDTIGGFEREGVDEGAHVRQCLERRPMVLDLL